ncbi:DUF2529 family protein [Salibacterium aidingense]|uniref:DUF2529 family protein n=1 Tax=Salibacterium aidingense TaxID=384933 RepID=UPI003BBAEAA3
MKIFATQLQGAFQNILAEEEAVENGARLLAQGPGGAGRLLIYSTSSLEGIASVLASHPDAPENTWYFTPYSEEPPAAADRVLLLAGPGEKRQLTTVLEPLVHQGVPVVIVAPFPEDDLSITLEPTDVWLQTHVEGGIVPDENGERTGDPSALCTLFAGQLLFLNMKEMLDELG